MIKTTFKAHPIMIVRLIKPYIFVLILPLIRALIQYITKGEIDGLLSLELIAFAFVLVMAILGRNAILVTVDGDHITLKRGVLVKTCAVIEISRISSISLKQNVIDFIFRSVDCSINTEAGRPQKSDFNLKMSKTDAKMLYKLVYGEEKQKTIKFSAYRIALLAATTSSAATGIIVGVPIINKASDLVGIAISDMLINEINNVSSRFNNVFPPIVNTVTIALLLAYGFSFVVSFLKNVNFNLKSSKHLIEVRSGLIVRKVIAFKKSMVNNICFEQTPLMRFFKKYSMRASIGGYGDSKGEKAVIVPVAAHKELERRLKEHFPNLQPQAKSIAPLKCAQSLSRFLYIPIILAVVIAGLCIIGITFFPYFDKLVLFLSLVLLGIDAYYASVCYRNYKCGKICLGEYLLASGSEGLKVRELYCKSDKIGVIKITQTPADQKFKTCKVKFTVRSENADSVRVKNINLKQVKETINRVFKINIDE